MSKTNNRLIRKKESGFRLNLKTQALKLPQREPNKSAEKGEESGLLALRHKLPKTPRKRKPFRANTLERRSPRRQPASVQHLFDTSLIESSPLYAQRRQHQKASMMNKMKKMNSFTTPPLRECPDNPDDIKFTSKFTGHFRSRSSIDHILVDKPESPESPESSGSSGSSDDSGDSESSDDLWKKPDDGRGMSASAPAPFPLRTSSGKASTIAMRKLCPRCRVFIANERSRFCADCGTLLVRSGDKDMDENADGKKILKRYEMVLNQGLGACDDERTGIQEGRIINEVRLFYCGLPDIKWYSFEKDAWYLGVRPQKYPALLQTIKGFLRKGTTVPWPVMEHFYGITSTLAITECFVNKLTGTLTVDISRRIQHIPQPDPTVKGKMKHAPILQIPTMFEEAYVAKLAPISYRPASQMGREISLGASERFVSDADWERVFHARQLPFYEGPHHFLVTQKYVDTVNDLSADQVGMRLCGQKKKEKV